MWTHFSLLYSFFPLNTTKHPENYTTENDKRTLKPGKKKEDWLRTLELEEKQCSESPGFSVFLTFTLHWAPERPATPKHQQDESISSLRPKDQEKGEPNRNLVGTPRTSSTMGHQWAV